MSTSSKSFFTFLAGAATAAAAAVFFKSDSGAKFRKTVVKSLKNMKNQANTKVNSDWINELSDSAIDAAKRFKSKIKD